MNKTFAKELVDKIDNYQLQQMLDNAKAGIKDWTIASYNNRAFSKGAIWNLLTNAFKLEEWNHPIIKYNLIREFGEYLPEYLKPKTKEKLPEIKVVHQDPIFKS